MICVECWEEAGAETCADCGGAMCNECSAKTAVCSDCKIDPDDERDLSDDYNDEDYDDDEID